MEEWRIFYMQQLYHSAIYMISLAIVSLLSALLVNAFIDLDSSNILIRDLWMPSYFQSGMILQRAPEKSAIHGKAAPGDLITLELRRGGIFIELEGKADANGRWLVELPPQHVGEAANIKIKSQQTGQVKELDDVLFGDVIFCSVSIFLTLIIFAYSDVLGTIQHANGNQRNS
jgi:hypothetical protein